MAGILPCITSDTMTPCFLPPAVNIFLVPTDWFLARGKHTTTFPGDAGPHSSFDIMFPNVINLFVNRTWGICELEDWERQRECPSILHLASDGLCLIPLNPKARWPAASHPSSSLLCLAHPDQPSPGPELS